MSVDAPVEVSPLPPEFMARVGATPERERDLESFRALLIEANQRMNLVGDSTLSQFWRRHFIDSAQLLWFSPDTRVWADLGSGAGLPGLVLAILLQGKRGAEVHLVESMAKRCGFLVDVAQALRLPAVVHHARAEDLSIQVEMVTARACAPLDRLFGYAEPFFARGAKGLFLKGMGVDAELALARKAWRFDAESLGSLSDPRGRVLSVEGLRRA